MEVKIITPFTLFISDDDSESEFKEKSKKHKSTKLDLRKLQSPSNKNSHGKKSRLSDSALHEVEKRKKSSKRGTKSEYFTRTNSDSDSDFDMSKSLKRKVPSPDTKKTTTKKNPEVKEKSKSKPKTKSTDNKKKGLPYWIEVYVGKSGWITGNKMQKKIFM